MCEATPRQAGAPSDRRARSSSKRWTRRQAYPSRDAGGSPSLPISSSSPSRSRHSIGPMNLKLSSGSSVSSSTHCRPGDRPPPSAQGRPGAHRLGTAGQSLLKLVHPSLVRARELPTIHGTSGRSTSTQISFDRKIRATHALALLSHHPRGRAGKALITSPLLSTVELISGNAQLRLSYGRTVRPAETSHGPHHRVDLARLVRCPGWDSNPHALSDSGF